ncbi:hypothetical protein GS891_12230 [Rhodococcus hoagii]|nr:hypothetical protein [Prescottella equi]
MCRARTARTACSRSASCSACVGGWASGSSTPRTRKSGRTAARKAFKRLQHFFGSEKNDPDAKFPELNALVEEIRSTNGQEAIVLKNGGSIEFVARSKGSARGFTIDVVVMDEAQELADETSTR